MAPEYHSMPIACKNARRRSAAQPAPQQAKKQFILSSARTALLITPACTAGLMRRLASESLACTGLMLAAAAGFTSIITQADLEELLSGARSDSLPTWEAFRWAACLVWVPAVQLLPALADCAQAVRARHADALHAGAHNASHIHSR